MEMSSNYLLHCEVGSAMILRQLSIAQLNECTMTSFWSQQPYGMLMIVHVLTTTAERVFIDLTIHQCHATSFTVWYTAYGLYFL
jgi:hypothetical protein